MCQISKTAFLEVGPQVTAVSTNWGENHAEIKENRGTHFRSEWGAAVKEGLEWGHYI